MSDPARVEVYCDGAAVNNGSAGSIGFAAVLYSGGKTQEYSGAETSEKTSSNRAELLAIQLGLQKILNRSAEVLVSSDCEWAIRVLRGAYQATSNEELIRDIRALARLFRRIEFLWVRGHCGHEYNERAHTLANAAALKAEKERVPCPEGKQRYGSVLIPKSSSGSSLTTPVMKTKETVSRVSCAQARLNAVTNPTTEYFQSYVRWWNRLNADATTYTTERLQERAYQIGPRIAELKKTCQPNSSTYPEGWTGREWTETYLEMRRLEGQLEAIQETLARRKKAAGNGGLSRRSSSPPTATPDPEPDSTDPFQAE